MNFLDLLLVIAVVIFSSTLAIRIVYGPIRKDGIIYETIKNLSNQNFEINQFDSTIIYFGKFGHNQLVITKAPIPGLFSTFCIQTDHGCGIGECRIYRFSKAHKLINEFYKSRFKVTNP